MRRNVIQLLCALMIGIVVWVVLGIVEPDASSASEAFVTCVACFATWWLFYSSRPKHTPPVVDRRAYPIPGRPLANALPPPRPSRAADSRPKRHPRSAPPLRMSDDVDLLSPLNPISPFNQTLVGADSPVAHHQHHQAPEPASHHHTSDAASPATHSDHGSSFGTHDAGGDHGGFDHGGGGFDGGGHD